MTQKRALKVTDVLTHPGNRCPDICQVMFNTKFVSSHESVYLNVEKGLYPAGGGIIRTFEMMDNSISKNLRILWTTPQFTPHAIATHPKLPHDIAKKVLNTFLKMSSDPVGQQKLKLIGFKGIDAASDSDWDDIRHLNIADIDMRGE